MTQTPARPFFSALFHRVLALLRPACSALITPQTVVLDAGGKAQPQVHRLGSPIATRPEQFAAAVAALLQMLDAANLRGRRVHVRVSDAWARPAVLPLPPKAADDAAIDGLIAKHYRSVYGDLMSGWHWCWDLGAPHLVAVAWPVLGLEALMAGLVQRACILASAKPAGLDLAGGLLLGPNTCWLVSAAPQCLTLMRVQQGVLQDWSVHTGEADPTLSLQLLLAREAARRADTCHLAVIIDLHEVTDPERLQSNPVPTGWTSRAATRPELAGSLAWRLQQLLNAQRAA